MSGRPPSDPRLNQILDALLRFARQDFEARAPVSDAEDTIDAIATGLNMLAEELDAEVASRRELEHAYGRLRDTQAQLVHAGKLAAIGQIASGVAHEINNPAMGIEVVLELVARAVRDLRELAAAGGASSAELTSVSERMDAALSDARHALIRIRGVTGDLRTFARIDDDVIEAVDLDDVVQVSCRLAGPILRQRARLVLDLGGTPPVQGNRGRLGQVVTNLVVNAAQAVPDHDDREHEVRVITRYDGARVVLAVEDTGPGIAPHDRARVFEPFYTTKPAGEGTGLGLPLVAEIVASHGGGVHIGDAEGGGARVEVCLPATVASTAPADVVEEETAAASPQARVLLVDDEDIIVRLMEALLEDECELVTANSGAAAIALLGDGLDVDLILCDLHMPGTDGIDVFEFVSGQRPELEACFVFTTGGATSRRSREFLDRTQARVLAKPFPAQDLIDLVASARRS